jgi:methylated-DNA-[protein]-cysteine S-methyltransferase
MTETFTAYDAIAAAPGFSLGIRCCATEHQVSAIDFLPPQAIKAPTTAIAAETIHQLNAYFQDPHFTFNLPLKTSGTPFQRQVWAQIVAIPHGKTRTYGELAKTLQNAPRAVGQACGANPLPIIVPCHRVIAQNGGLGGFNRQGGGFLVEIKRWLLAHEATASS